MISAAEGGTVLILGSGPRALDSRAWPKSHFDTIVAINNAWAVRPDWDVLIHPDDFPSDRMPPQIGAEQQVIGSASYVPTQNIFGGFVYGGGTMAFTAGYWALAALRPRVMAFFGCDMVYSAKQTHFYGTGAPDPLRDDPTLQSLEAKSARLHLLAARQGCACVNLSDQKSRLVFPQAELSALPEGPPAPVSLLAADQAEATLGYSSPTGRYWEQSDQFDPAKLAEIDALWLEAHEDWRAAASPKRIPAE